MTTLQDYVGHSLKGRVLCGDHAHEVIVKVTEIAGDTAKVEPLDDEPFCSMNDETVGWVQPLWDDELDFGGTPFIGETEADAHLELDFWE